MTKRLFLWPIGALAGILASCASDDDAPAPNVDAGAGAAIDGSAALDPDAAVDASLDAEAIWYPSACTPTTFCAIDVGIDPTAKLAGISVTATDIWAVGGQGLVVHHDGQSWTHTVLSPPNPQSTAVDSLAQVIARGNGAVWALANLSTLYTGPGAGDAGPSGFAPVPLPQLGNLGLTTLGLWAHPDTPTSAWITGDYVYRVDMTTTDGPTLTPYTALLPGAPFYGPSYVIAAVHGSTKDELWAVGRTGAAYHVANVDAQTPFVEELNSQTYQTLDAVWAFSAVDVWAAGGAGTLRHYSGSGHTWEIIDSPTTETLRAMWASSPNDLWAVGDSAVVIHYDGTAWQRVPVAGLDGRKVDIKAMWGASAGRVFAVADNLVLALGTTTVTK